MKKFLGIVILLIVAYVVPVNACSFTFEDYKKTGEVHSLIVGEYVFDLSNGHSPSLEDFSIAARTIPEGQDEYVYEIIYTPVLNIYKQTEVFSNKTSNRTKDWPSFFDTTYNYRSNINIKNPDYDIFTCKTDNIKISYSLLNTKGEGEYKTEASRLVDIQSTVELGKSYYCLTSDSECKPDQKINVEGNSSSNFIDYPTNELPQHICAEAFDKYGNTSGVVCDTVMVKVDSEPIKIKATEEYNNVIEGAPHTVDGLFNVKYSVSKGNVYYFYVDEGRQYVLTNLRDLPSGEVDVKAIGRSGSGLITEEVRTINVRKSVVKYDYKTNGGTSASKDTDTVSYEDRADLSVTANKDGYTFVGWNTDPKANFALETVNITEDTTLYAIFKKVISARFEIYNKQGNIPAVAEYDKAECEVYNNETECEVIAPKISPRVRYEALGWSREKDDTAEIQGGDKLLVSNNEVIYSVTRNLIPNTATFIILKDGEPSKEVKTCYLYNGDTECSISINEIKSDDYEGKELAGFTSSDNKVVEPDDYVITGGKTFYAYYDDSYEINFVSDSTHIETMRTGVDFIVTENEIKKVTSKVIAPTPIEKNNYTIIGWRDDLKTEDATVTPGDQIDANSNVTYYAIYSKEITISYTSEGSSKVPESRKYKIYYNAGSGTSSQALVTLDSGVDMKNDGFIFNGWNSEGEHYNQGITYPFDTSKTFEAEWTENATLVVFDYKTNGGSSSSVESSTYVHGVSKPIDLSKIIAYRRGYEFVGWSLYPTATSTGLTSYTPTEGTNKVTLYAIYRKNITVRFENIDQSALYIPDGNVIKFTIYNNSDGENIKMPAVTSNYNYIEFIGWNTNQQATKKQYSPGDTVKIKDNTTFYTIVKNTNPLTSTYIYYDGNIRKTKTSKCYLYNNNTSCATESELSGFIYDGGVLSSWSSSPNSVIIAKEQTISTNTTFYGVYDKILTITYLSGMYTDTTPQSRETDLVTAKYLTNTTGITSLEATIKLSTPDGVAGFVTEGWRKDSEAETAEYQSQETLNVIEDETFYGVYSKVLSLRYATLGGNPIPETESKVLWYNSDIKNPDNKVSFTVAGAPTKTGVRLESWLLENDDTKSYQPNDTVEINDNSTMYAKWTPNSYTVTLNGEANGGSDPNNNVITKYFEESFELENYNAIPREGYEFVGWATSPDSKDILTEYIIPANDSTLYAVYKKTLNANWMMYDTNAGTSDSPVTTCDIYNNETECNAPVGTITVNDSYQAVGWSKERGSINVDAGIGLAVTINQNTDFYSITKKSQDLIGTFYYFNNGSVTNVTSSCGLYNGATSCTISTPSTPSNHKSTVFQSWSSTTNKNTASSLNISANTNYYAYYTQITELTYHDGTHVVGVTGDEIDENATGKADISSKTETLLSTVEYIAHQGGEWSSIPTRIIKTPVAISGYSAIGWRDNKEKKVQNYNANQTVSMVRSYELFAVYNRTITLSYDPQGGKTTPAKQTATQYYNSGSGCTSHTFTLASEIARTGYTFKGWRLDSTSGTQYNAGASINILKDSKMYAYFTPNNYTVYFNANGGNTPNPSSKTVTYYSTYGTLASVSRTGYTFNGWYTSASEGTQITDSTKVSITSNQTLYAHWTVNSYSVSISVGTGGSVSKTSMSINYGGTNTFTVTPNSGYYLESISCTNGYISSGYSTGMSSTSAQTVTISNNNNTTGTTCSISFKVACIYTPGQVVGTYEYTGGIQSYVAQCNGTYKLEVYGSEGLGINGGIPGKGGYSVGNIELSKDTTIYIVIGGQYGYNGGGSPGENGGYGGGATHIATRNGLLSSLESYKSDILIVAGGGGGAEYEGWEGGPSTGGSGGGLSGGKGTGAMDSEGIDSGYGGTQTAGGHGDGGSGSFGQGGGGTGWATGGCGGGGYYGGGAGSGNNGTHGGGGGSGYIGGVTGGSMQNGIRSGHGYARITFISAQ